MRLADHPACADARGSRAEDRGAPTRGTHPSRRTRTAPLLLVGVVLLALLAPLGGRARASGELTLVRDTFSRVADPGWASTDSGARYAFPAGAEGFAVDGDQGSLAFVAPGEMRLAEIAGISRRDVDVRFRLRLDALPTGDGVVVVAVLRRVGDREYRVRLRLLPDGSAWLALVRYERGVTTELGDERRLDGVTVAAATSLHLRAQVRGVDPTLLRARAWPAGRAQPTAWTIAHRDVAIQLRHGGSLGIRAFLTPTASRVPLVLRFDDLRVRHVRAGAGRTGTGAATRPTTDGGDGADPTADPTPGTGASPGPTPTPEPAPTPTPDAPVTFYVATDGDDDAPGTAARPWRTLQRAADSVPAGATVLVRQGRYAGFTVRRSGVPGEPTIFRGDPSGAMPVLDGAINGRLDVVRVNGAHDVRIQGFEITGAQGGGYRGAGVRTENGATRIVIAANVIRGNRSFGIDSHASTEVTIRDNEVSGNETGIQIAYAGDGSRVLDNRVHHNDRMLRDTPTSVDAHDDSGAVGIGFLRSSGAVLVSGNRVWGNRAASHDYGWDGAAFEIYGASNVTITDNVAFDNENVLETGTDAGGPGCIGNRFVRNVAYGEASQGRSWGMFLRCAADMLIANNTFEGLDGFVFAIGYDSRRFSGAIDGLRIANNVIDQAATGAKVFGLTSELPASVRINDDLLRTTGVLATLPDGRQTSSLETFHAWTGFEGRGITGDPRFADATRHDYALRATSPAVDRGVVIETVSDVYSGAAPDRGRHERLE